MPNCFFRKKQFAFHVASDDLINGSAIFRINISDFLNLLPYYFVYYFETSYDDIINIDPQNGSVWFFSIFGFVTQKSDQISKICIVIFLLISESMDFRIHRLILDRRLQNCIISDLFMRGGIHGILAYKDPAIWKFRRLLNSVEFYWPRHASSQKWFASPSGDASPLLNPFSFQSDMWKANDSDVIIFGGGSNPVDNPWTMVCV